MNDYGKMTSISEIHDFQIGDRAPLNEYDGYEVKTD